MRKAAQFQPSHTPMPGTAPFLLPAAGHLSGEAAPAVAWIVAVICHGVELGDEGIRGPWEGRRDSILNRVVCRPTAAIVMQDAAPRTNAALQSANDATEMRKCRRGTPVDARQNRLGKNLRQPAARSPPPAERSRCTPLGHSLGARTYPSLLLMCLLQLIQAVIRLPRDHISAQCTRKVFL